MYSFFDAHYTSNLQNNNFTKNKKKTHKKQPQNSKQNANTQPFSEYFNVRTRFILILCFVYMLSYGESKSTTTSYVLISMHLMSGTSNFEYEQRFLDIRISLHEYKYQIL